MNLTRRFFLKGLAGVTAGLYITKFDLIFPNCINGADQQLISIADFRILTAYSIEDDLEYIRYDVFDGTTQLHISGAVTQELKTAERFYHTLHCPMKVALLRELKRRRIRSSQLQSLSYPPGYKHPDWLINIAKDLPKLKENI